MMIAPAPRPGIMTIKPYVGGDSAVAGARTVIKLASNESALTFISSLKAE